MDLLGKALTDYYQGRVRGPLIAETSLGFEEEFPVSHFFRDVSQMPELERIALDNCRGRVLDVGCGAGSHSLVLQERGFACTGLDLSEGAIRVARERGLKYVECIDIRSFGVGKFDTLLLLMNGVGLAGTLDKLGLFLKHLKGLLHPGGQILLDSSDLQYLYERDPDGGLWVPGDRAYYGEMRYRWRYGSEKGPDFSWLFVDYEMLQRVARDQGMGCELLETGPHYDYLARITE